MLTRDRTIASRLVTEVLPRFDLIVATLGREEELGRLFDSLERQTHGAFRVVVADQNADDRAARVLAGRALDVLHLRAESGLSRARNEALAHVEADVVAFPDDDCVYADDLLEGVARRLGDDPGLDGLTGREIGADGRSTPSWRLDAAMLTEENLWNRAISFTIFLRRGVIEAVGRFDEELGLGSGTPWASGEETDYLIRAIRGGARIAYDPALTVAHDLGSPDARIRYRDGASLGYLLRKHRYPLRTRARMLIRPLGGIAVALARLDTTRARLHLATLRGRLAGLRARPAK